MPRPRRRVFSIDNHHETTDRERRGCQFICPVWSCGPPYCSSSPTVVVISGRAERICTCVARPGALSTAPGPPSDDCPSSRLHFNTKKRVGQLSHSWTHSWTIGHCRTRDDAQRYTARSHGAAKGGHSRKWCGSPAPQQRGLDIRWCHHPSEESGHRDSEYNSTIRNRRRCRRSPTSRS